MKRKLLKFLTAMVALLFCLPSFADELTITMNDNGSPGVKSVTPADFIVQYEGINGSFGTFGGGQTCWSNNCSFSLTLNKTINITGITVYLRKYNKTFTTYLTVNGGTCDVSGATESQNTGFADCTASGFTTDPTNQIIVSGGYFVIKHITITYTEGGGDIKQNPNLSFTPDFVQYTMGEGTYPTLNKPEDLSLSDFTWTSSNPTVATVDAEGNVTPLRAGGGASTTITASFAGNDNYTDGSASYDIYFWKGSTSISFEKGSIDMTYGEAVPANPLANVQNVPVTWSSSDETVATVDQTGAVEVLKAGTTTISATPTETALNLWDGVYTQSYTLTVNPAEAKTAAPRFETEPVTPLHVGDKLILVSDTENATISYKVVYAEYESSTPDFDAAEEVTAASPAEITVTEAGKWMFIRAVATAEGLPASNPLETLGMEVIATQVVEGSINFDNLKSQNPEMVEAADMSSIKGSEINDPLTYEENGAVYVLVDAACGMLDGVNVWQLAGGALYNTAPATTTNALGNHIGSVDIITNGTAEDFTLYYSKDTPLTKDNYQTEGTLVSLEPVSRAANHLRWNNGNNFAKYIYLSNTASPVENMAINWSDNNVETGVAGIEAEDGEAVYFNLQGVRVANPEKGIYVRVQNGKAVKVML